MRPRPASASGRPNSDGQLAWCVDPDRPGNGGLFGLLGDIVLTMQNWRWANHRNIRLRSFLALVEELLRSRGLQDTDWDAVLQAVNDRHLNEAERALALVRPRGARHLSRGSQPQPGAAGTHRVQRPQRAYAKRWPSERSVCSSSTQGASRFAGPAP
jgi:hypothetical protein